MNTIEALVQQTTTEEQIETIKELVKETALPQITVSQFASKGLERDVVIRAYRELEKEGHGAFIVGRKSWPSRFDKSAAVKTPRHDTDRAPAMPPVDSLPSPITPSATDSDPLEVSLLLREGFRATVTLPRNVSASEVRRMIRLLQALPDSN